MNCDGTWCINQNIAWKCPLCDESYCQDCSNEHIIWAAKQLQEFGYQRYPVIHIIR